MSPVISFLGNPGQMVLVILSAMWQCCVSWPPTPPMWTFRASFDVRSCGETELVMLSRSADHRHRWEDKLRRWRDTSHTFHVNRRALSQCPHLEQCYTWLYLEYGQTLQQYHPPEVLPCSYQNVVRSSQAQCRLQRSPKTTQICLFLLIVSIERYIL